MKYYKYYLRKYYKALKFHLINCYLKLPFSSSLKAAYGFIDYCFHSSFKISMLGYYKKNENSSMVPNFSSYTLVYNCQILLSIDISVEIIYTLILFFIAMGMVLISFF